MIYDSPPLVEVIWNDTTGWSGWFEQDEWVKKEMMPVRSVGFMLEKTRKLVRISMDYRADGIAGCVCAIPRGTVVQIRELEQFLKEEE